MLLQSFQRAIERENGIRRRRETRFASRASSTLERRWCLPASPCGGVSACMADELPHGSAATAMKCARSIVAAPAAANGFDERVSCTSAVKLSFRARLTPALMRDLAESSQTTANNRAKLWDRLGGLSSSKRVRRRRVHAPPSRALARPHRPIAATRSAHDAATMSQFLADLRYQK
jgi:hypothetical protein